MKPLIPTSACNLAVLFAGAGGVEVGAQLAGFTPIWSIEREKRPAQIHRYNIGNRLIQAPIEAVDPTRLPSPYILWASPPCQHASHARQNHNLPDHPDRYAGSHVVPYIHELRPEWFILENVTMYRFEPSYKDILRCLEIHGYAYEAKLLDFADYGVPMNRKRLILIATRTDAGFPEKQPQVPWGEAAQDIWQTLPKGSFPPYMREFIKDFTGDFIANSQNYSKPPRKKFTIRPADEPMFTATVAHAERPCYGTMGGDVRKITARAWARFMTLPDSYALPRAYRFAMHCIGEMVPPVFVKNLLHTLMKGA